MVNSVKQSSAGIILTRTPLRVSFAGGGTDLPVFYECQDGAVLSTAINKYVYVTVKRHSELFGEPIRLNYSETEQVKNIDEIKNDIARECLRFLEIEPPIYISTVADIPAASGLGSSSSFAVGLLNALHGLRGDRVSAGQLAEEAAHIEIEVLKRPMGKQDHYAAAFGGLNYICFFSNGRVSIEPQHRQKVDMDKLFDHILMFWTGMGRNSSSILSEQQRNTASKMDSLLAMREHAMEIRTLLMQNDLNLPEFGKVLDNSWQFKRQLASSITNDQIDQWYQLAMAAGAIGGKLCGAGGGGFLLFIVTPEHQESVRRSLADLTEISVGYESQGSRLLLIE